MSLDDELDRLYRLPPEEFVGARNELVKHLRADQQREPAAEVKALRRPSVAAWAVNQLARRDPSGVAELLEAGTALRAAQRRALSGGKGQPLRQAAAGRRAVVERLTETSRTILRDAGRDPAPHERAVAATLEAASSDDTAAEAVQLGRLSNELAPPADFGDISALTLVAGDLSSDDRPPSESEDDGPDHDAIVAAEKAIAAVRDRATEASEKAVTAERGAADARAAAQQAQKDARALERQAEQARQRAEAAEREAAKMAKQARSAQEAAKRQADELRKAERQLAKR